MTYFGNKRDKKEAEILVLEIRFMWICYIKFIIVLL